MMYTREQFTAAIESIRRANAFQDAVNTAGKYSNFNDGNYVEYYPPICDEELCKALEAMFDDPTGAVCWFCFEINYGAEYEDYANVSDGREWPLRTVDELYDYLTRRRDER